MTRLVLAFLLAPLPLSLVFGPFVVFAYPFMLAMTILVGVPLLLVLSSVRALDWWHAMAAGAFCGCLPTLLDGPSLVVGVDLILSGPDSALISVGAGTGLVFWWMGVFRNPRFDFISRTVPVASFLAVPLLVLLVIVGETSHRENATGRVVGVMDADPYDPLPSSTCVARVGLEDGRVVLADVRHCDGSFEEIIGRCFRIDERWSTLRFAWVWKLSSPLGRGEDAC